MHKKKRQYRSESDLLSNYIVASLASLSSQCHWVGRTERERERGFTYALCYGTSGTPVHARTMQGATTSTLNKKVRARRTRYSASGRRAKNKRGLTCVKREKEAIVLSVWEWRHKSERESTQVKWDRETEREVWRTSAPPPPSLYSVSANNLWQSRKAPDWNTTWRPVVVGARRASRACLVHTDLTCVRIQPTRIRYVERVTELNAVQWTKRVEKSANDVLGLWKKDYIHLLNMWKYSKLGNWTSQISFHWKFSRVKLIICVLVT